MTSSKGLSRETDPLLGAHCREEQSTPQTSAEDSKAAACGPLQISVSKRYSILAGLWVATCLSSANSTLVATLLPVISSEFHNANQASWLGTAYLLATCTFTPLYGRLCNVTGRRTAMQTAVILAAIGTAACASAQSMKMLIAARFISGLGGGGILTTATIVTSDMYSLRARGLTQGVAMLFNSIGMGLGGPLGGLISDRFGWRWAFIIQIPLFALSLLLTTINLDYVTEGRGKTTKDCLRRIDYAGTITLFGSVFGLLLFLGARYNADYPWSSPYVYLPLASSAAFFISFLVIELMFVQEPVLPLFLLKQKVPVLIGLSNFFTSINNYAILYYFPTWFQTVMLSNASEAGAHMIPSGVAFSAGSLFAGWMIHQTGTYKVLDLICGTFPFVSALLISRMHENSSQALLWLGIIPVGFGNAVVLQTMLIARLAHLPESAIAVGTGFGQLFRGLGQVGGVAISSAIFQSVLETELQKCIHGEDAKRIISSIRHSTKIVAHLPPELQQAAKESYAIGLRSVFLLAACATGMAYLVRLPIPDKSLDDPRKTSESRSNHD